MKQGRNEQCECGSGKKYKHCCIKMRAVSLRGMGLSASISRFKDHQLEIHCALLAPPPSMTCLYDEKTGELLAQGSTVDELALELEKKGLI